jgi:hypothetical protein
MGTPALFSTESCVYHTISLFATQPGEAPEQTRTSPFKQVMKQAV